MQPYKSKSGKQSGVSAFKINEDSILVEFNNGERYLYTYASAGEKAIEKMKKLALAGKGLSTYISQNDPGFE